jgi:hypothetical protein
MPYRMESHDTMEWHNAEVFCEHHGVTIYHAYKDDDFDNRLFYWYALDPAADHEFDVRDLPGAGAANLITLENIKTFIKRTIDAGILTQTGITREEAPPS